MMSGKSTLEYQRNEFSKNRLLAMPLAGAIAWLGIASCNLFLSQNLMPWAVYIGTGLIAYLGMGLSKITGEDFLDRSKPKNEFTTLFLYTVAMAWLVFAIAIPFAVLDPTSVPLTFGVLSGLMWLPLSWIIQHWIGVFHSVTRTVSLLSLWYAFPEKRFIVLPIAIVAVYGVTIVFLELRWRTATQAQPKLAIKKYS